VARMGVGWWVARIGVVWIGVVWVGVVWVGVVWIGLLWRGVVWVGFLWRGVVWIGLLWKGVVWIGLLWRGVVWIGLLWRRVIWMLLTADRLAHTVNNLRIFPFPDITRQVVNTVALLVRIAALVKFVNTIFEVGLVLCGEITRNLKVGPGRGWVQVASDLWRAA